MPQLTISEVARRAGLQPSAIRYYEQIGILFPPQRISGQRRYDTAVLHRLAVIQRARQTGFTLDEIRELFFGFREVVPASQRWQKLSRKKLEELEELIRQIKTMQQLLRKMMDCCRCDTLDQCGRGIFENGFKGVTAQSRPAKVQARR
ncbi:MAG TPA: MerR family transcriptional regulator [Terriglobales bacterium]|jgi:MerR family redox-sensitive transcriptional activator SoxR|nr:MerR family transcriptional regulator [Terriglobales bacterium]